MGWHEVQRKRRRPLSTAVSCHSPRFFNSEGSHPNAVGRGKSLILDVAGIADRRGFEDQDFGLGIRSGSVFDAMWHDDELARAKVNHMVAKLDAEAALPDEEHLILMLVPMPRELTSNLDELDLLPIQLGYDLRTPVFVEESELVRQTDLFHRANPQLGADLVRVSPSQIARKPASGKSRGFEEAIDLGR